MDFRKLFPLLAAIGFAHADIRDPNDWQLTVDHTQEMSVTDVTPDIISETVKGLENDPLRIFSYVLNHFDYQPYFGLYKGYERTFYDRAGNDADLCHLLAKMLTLAGYNPEYVEGWMTIPETKLSRWLKTKEDTDGYVYDFNTAEWDDLGISLAIQNALYMANIYHDPNTIDPGAYDPDTQTGVYTFSRRLYRICLKVSIGGTVHILDPAFKEYDRVERQLSPAGLGSLMGYTAPSLLNSLGGTPVTNGMKDLDEAALRGALSGYATSLKSALLSTYQGKNLDQVFGGHELVKKEFSTLPTAPEFGFSQVGASYSAFPHYRKHYFQFKYSTIDVLFATADVNPKRLYLTFDNQRAELFLDGIEIAEETSVGAATDAYFLCVDHPYLAERTSLDEEREAVTALSRDTDCLLVSKHFASTFHDRWFNKVLDETKELRAQAVPDNDIRMLSRNLQLYGIAYNVEKAGFLSLIAQTSENAISYLFHDAGVTFQDAGFGMSWLASGILSTGYTGWDGPTQVAKSNKIAAAASYYGSALEHNIIDQLQEDNGGISTVRGFSFANDASQELYFLNRSQYNSLRPTLVSSNWSAIALQSADDIFSTDPGAKILIHRDFNLTSPIAGHTWTGGVYWVLPSNSNGGLFLLSGLFNGGQSNFNGIWEYILDLGNSITGGIAKIFPGVAGVTVGFVEGIFGFNPTSAEPVDLATGAYLSEHTDLSLGSGALPKGVSLTRSYNSLRRQENHEMGYGWTHSLDVHAARTTHFPILFGGRLPVDTVAQLVGSYVTAEIADMGQDDLKEVMALMMTSHWATDEIVDNATVVKTGHRSDIYSRQSDGTYTSPPGVTDTLALSGNNFAITQRHGSTYQFGDVNGSQRLSSVIDLHGNTANFAYDGSHRLSSVSDAFSRTITFNYDGTTGYLDTISDNTGRTIDYTIDGNGDQTAYTNADSQQFTLGYDTEHQITEWRDDENRIIAQNVYNSLGQVVTQYSEGLANHEWTFLYTGFENIEQDPLGNRKHYRFDEQLNFTGYQDGEGNRSWVDFDVEKRAVRQTGSTGRYREITYNSDHNPTAVIEYDAGGIILRQRGFSYDASKRLHIETNARGYTTTHTYNAQHQVLTTKRQNETGNSSFSYNPDGTLDWTEDQNSDRTSFGYDAYDNISLVTFPDSTTTSAIFNMRGDPTSGTDARGKTTGHQYNNRRLKTRVTNHLNDYTETAYNGMGKPTTVRGFRGAVTTSSYNALGNIVGVDHPLITGNTVYAYDRADRLVSITSPEGVVRSSTLDNAGRAVATTNPVSSASNVFDARGLVEKAIDPLSQETDYTHDAFGRVKTITNDLSETITYFYDENDNRTGIQNARQKTHVFTFDSLDRLEKVSTPDGHETITTFTNRHQIDVVTRPSALTSDFGYDNMSRITTVTDGVGTLIYSHDDNGNATAITQGSQSISYVYDDLNRVSSYTDENGNTITYGYDANGNITRLTYPGNLDVTYTYDALNRMTSVTDWNNRQTTYSYDEDGRLKTVTRPNGTVRRHDYDAAGRLIQVVEEDANGYIVYRSDLGLDLAGKVSDEFRIPKSYGFTAVPVWSATHNDDDELDTISAGTAVSDIDGNLIQAPLSATVQSGLVYNARNQLTSVAALGSSYSYGVEGQRLTKIVAAQATTFVNNPLGRTATVLMETTGGVIRYYIYGLGLIAHQEGTDYRTYHFDHIGNTVALTMADGATISDRFEYSPYGVESYRDGTTETPFRFNGMHGVYSDAESGLIHMNAATTRPS